jgi:hypothetical protein
MLDVITHVTPGGNVAQLGERLQQWGVRVIGVFRG